MKDNAHPPIKFIAHRINTQAELLNVPREYGVELDLRDRGEKIILVHDPFKDGEDFESYLMNYHHGLMILNVKSERLEPRILELMKHYKVQDYFFLDSTFPMLVTLAKQGIKNLALRFSEYEGLDTIEKMQGLAKFVWVDCFTHWPLTPENYQAIKKWGYQIVLVSPELQGRPSDLPNYAQKLQTQQLWPDYICSKLPQIAEWKNIFR